MKEFKFDNEVIKKNIFSHPRKMTYEELLDHLSAENLFWDDRTVRRWFKKNDYSNMTVNVLHIICKALDCFPSEILCPTEYSTVDVTSTLKELLEILRKNDLNCELPKDQLDLKKMDWELKNDYVGRNLLLLRESQGFSMKTLGKKIGCSKVMVHKLEAGSSNLTIPRLIQYQNIFHVSAEYILYGKNVLLPSTLRLMFKEIHDLTSVN